MLDLGEQYGLKRRLALNSLLAGPMTLQGFIVTIGEEGLRRFVEYRLEEMQSAKPIIQENAAPLGETAGSRGKLIQAF
jgi:hypothetical protein